MQRKLLIQLNLNVFLFFKYFAVYTAVNIPHYLEARLQSHLPAICFYRAPLPLTYALPTLSQQDLQGHGVTDYGFIVLFLV